LGEEGSRLQRICARVADIKRLFDEARSIWRLDILVNCAGEFSPSNIISTTEEVWDASLDANLKALFSGASRAPLRGVPMGQSLILSDTGGLLGWPACTWRTRFQKPGS